MKMAPVRANCDVFAATVKLSTLVPVPPVCVSVIHGTFVEAVQLHAAASVNEI
jgi:hypothetical protein